MSRTRSLGTLALFVGWLVIQASIGLGMMSPPPLHDWFTMVVLAVVFKMWGIETASVSNGVVPDTSPDDEE